MLWESARGVCLPVCYVLISFSVRCEPPGRLPSAGFRVGDRPRYVPCGRLPGIAWFSATAPFCPLFLPCRAGLCACHSITSSSGMSSSITRLFMMKFCRSIVFLPM